MRSALVLLLLTSLAHADGNGAEVVLTPITDAPKKPIRVDPPPGADKPAIVATVVAGGFIAAAGFSYVWAQHTLDKLDNIPLRRDIDAEPRRKVIDEADRWHNASYWLAAGSLVSVSIAGYLWTRTQPRFVPQVEATPHGGALGLAGSF